MSPPPILTPARFSASSTKAAARYMARVRSGSQPAGRLVRLAVERHLLDLERARFNFPYYFDPHGAKWVFRFFSFLSHYKGEWAGQQFRLAPWQAFIVWVLFGWRRRSDGLRRFRLALISVAKKNGKTTYAAAIGLYLFCADQEPGSDVYSAATTLAQARLSHGDATAMAKRSPELAERIEFFKDNLCIARTASKFLAIGAKFDTSDGLNVHGAIVDELHHHKGRDLWDVLEYGTSARRQPLMLGITTAGEDLDSFCYELREHAVKVLGGAAEDDALFAFLAEPDEEDNDEDPVTWAKGNPNLGISITVGALAQDHAKARSMESALGNFRRLRLNRWLAGGDEAFFDLGAWNACPSEGIDLTGRRCFGGLDLAATQDIAAFVLFFPPQEEGGLACARCYFFVPKDNILERARRYRVPLEAWIEHGAVRATEGNIIDYAVIQEVIEECAGVYPITEIAFDNWNATQIVVALGQKGLTMVPLTQMYGTYNAPLRKLEDLIAAGTFNHGGDPMLRWMAGNTVVETDVSGRIKPVKKKGRRRYKIDGIVALAMAMNRWMVLHEHDVENLSISWV